MVEYKICCVVSTNNPVQCLTNIRHWEKLFYKHEVTTIIVVDGEIPRLWIKKYEHHNINKPYEKLEDNWYLNYRKIIFRRSESVRNLGFLYASSLRPTYVLTIDDDVIPFNDTDPIQEHLNVLLKRTNFRWMNYLIGDEPYIKGIPDHDKNGVTIVLSHGVVTNYLNYDAKTVLDIQKNSYSIPKPIPYYFGTIPHQVFYPLSSANVMIHSSILPYFYFAPMGSDTAEQLFGYGSVWLGVTLKRVTDRKKFAWHVTRSLVEKTSPPETLEQLHMRLEKESLAREWCESQGDLCQNRNRYVRMYDICLESYYNEILRLMNERHFLSLHMYAKNVRNVLTSIDGLKKN